MDFDNIGKNISKKIIDYENINNYSLNQLFMLFSDVYKVSDTERDKLLMCTVNSITEQGYDIISTHPLKLERFK